MLKLPVKCSVCKEKNAVVHLEFSSMYYCEDCYTQYFIRKVEGTVKKYKMLEHVDKVLIAVSGGKDSAALLAALTELNYRVDVIPFHIDLGIPGYSEQCRKAVEELCKRFRLKPLIFKLETEGFTMADIAKRYRKPCSPCGIIKRYWMNRVSLERGVDMVLTGHNLDDTVEVLFQAYLTGSVQTIAKTKPKLERMGDLVSRAKPLIRYTDLETLYFSSINELPFAVAECPYAKGSRSLRRKKLIEKIIREIPNFKHTLLSTHLKTFQPLLEGKTKLPPLRKCIKCGMSASAEVCSYCKLKERILKH